MVLGCSSRAQGVVYALRLGMYHPGAPLSSTEPPFVRADRKSARSVDLRCRASDVLRSGAAGNDDPGGEHLHRFAVLIAGFAAHGDAAAVRPGAGRRQLQHLAGHLQDVAGPGRLRPSDLTAGTDDTTGNGRTACHQEAHGDGGRVPAAGGKPTEQRRLGGFVVQVKRLRIVLPGEVLDLLGCEDVALAHESLAHGKIIEVVEVFALHLFSSHPHLR